MSQLPPQISVVELVVEPDPAPVEPVGLRVTDDAVLYVPADIDPDLAAAIVDAICQC